RGPFGPLVAAFPPVEGGASYAGEFGQIGDAELRVLARGPGVAAPCLTSASVSHVRHPTGATGGWPAIGRRGRVASNLPESPMSADSLPAPLFHALHI